MTEQAKKKSDLGVRAASAVVMVAIAGTAIWLGGWWWTAFVALIAAICFFEFIKLIRGAFGGGARASLGVLAGAFYIGLAGWTLSHLPVAVLVGVVAVVIATDVGAYFSGRAIGGPKIAPKISPSKTWAGLIGGAALAGAVSAGFFVHNTGEFTLRPMLFIAFALGAMLAVLAQCGDFFESWLKRKAGVKDSSNLIPGHGGVFDRVDGLLPVAIAAFPLWALHP
ncbi:MAG: phosphatidate cytidylyltransferase [Pontixanthobacter sp.]